MNRMPRRTELKALDLPVANTVSHDAIAIALPLAGIAQGSDTVNRTGRKVTIKKVSWKLLISWNQTETTVLTSLFRFIIFQDRSGIGATPTLANLLHSIGLGTLSFINRLGSPGRFKVLHDEVFVMSRSFLTTTATTNPPHSDLKILRGSLRKAVTVAYDGTGATSENKNSIWYFIFSDNAMGDDPSIDGHWRIYFTDA